MHKKAATATNIVLSAYNGTMTKTTNSERVMRANAKLVELGGRRMPGGYLKPDAKAALEYLLEVHYEESSVAVISKALLDARKNIEKKCK